MSLNDLAALRAKPPAEAALDPRLREEVPVFSKLCITHGGFVAAYEHGPWQSPRDGSIKGEEHIWILVVRASGLPMVKQAIDKAQAGVTREWVGRDFNDAAMAMFRVIEKRWPLDHVKAKARLNLYAGQLLKALGDDEPETLAEVEASAMALLCVGWLEVRT